MATVETILIKNALQYGKSIINDLHVKPIDEGVHLVLGDHGVIVLKREDLRDLMQIADRRRTHTPDAVAKLADEQ